MRDARPGEAGPLVFRTSSHSGGGNCVEVGLLPGGGVILRDTKDPLRTVRMVFGREEWSAFLRGVKAGEFDL